MIQDYIFAVGNIVFIIALLPALRSSEKPPAITSFLNTGVLITFAGSFASLNLWFSAFVTTISGLCWLMLGMQKAFRKPIVEKS